ncbi:hypothetical protein [Pontibacillus chungwhensis]|uniref:hypothetical protein n=1 Tax=Pontibacillus chungwhensis TaxID=265426 RepID=UPI000A9FEC54|nr:hypothetical protein [Pontibacillus chungwhensis]
MVNQAKTVESDGKHFYFLSVPEPTSSITYKVKAYSVDGKVIEDEEIQSLIVSK